MCTWVILYGRSCSAMAAICFSSEILVYRLPKHLRLHGGIGRPPGDVMLTPNERRVARIGGLLLALCGYPLQVRAAHSSGAVLLILAVPLARNHKGRALPVKCGATEA